MTLGGAIAEAVVLIRADGSTFQSDVTHEGSLAGTRAGSAFGDTFKRRAKAALAVGGAAIFAGLAATVRTGFGEVQDYDAGLKKLRATFRSTRTDVGLTVPQLEKLASRIQNYSGQTDDSIVAAETQLKTFKAVRDELGKGNDIFTRATKASADMSAQWGGEASQNAIKLGKALNDPIAGATALSKIGVQFSAEQKEQIKTLVEHNHMLRAQKLVLGEVEGQAKGVARAYGRSLPGQIERTKRAFEDTSQELATDLLPYALKFTQWLRRDALPALEDFGGWVKGHKTQIEWFAGIVAGLAVGFKAFKGVRSIQALVGRGPLTGGGGIAGSSRPVPVYVTNPGFAAGGAGRAGGGAYGTTSRGGGGGLLFGALAGFGIDLGLRQLPGPVGDAARHNAFNPVGQTVDRIRGLGNNLAILSGDKMGPAEAAARKLQKTSLDLADAIREDRDAADEYLKKGAQLNQLLGVTPSKLSAADSATKHFTNSLFGLADGAGKAGRSVGVDFGAGLVEGLHSKDGEVRQAAEYQASLLEKYQRLAIASDSPSKVAREIGRDWDDGLILGLRDKQDQINKEISAQITQLGTLRSNAQSLASGVRGAILGDSSILNTPDQTVAGIKHYFRHVAQVDRRFKHQIDRLRDLHIPKALANELAGAGPVEAGNIVRQLLRGDRHDRRVIGREYLDIRHTAQRAGKAARQETYDPQIKQVVDKLQALREDLHQISAELRGAEHRQAARTSR